jgi:hypothetical protein
MSDPKSEETQAEIGQAEEQTAKPDAVLEEGSMAVEIEDADVDAAVSEETIEEEVEAEEDWDEDEDEEEGEEENGEPA